MRRFLAPVHRPLDPVAGVALIRAGRTPRATGDRAAWEPSLIGGPHQTVALTPPNGLTWAAN